MKLLLHLIRKLSKVIMSRISEDLSSEESARMEILGRFLSWLIEKRNTSALSLQRIKQPSFMIRLQFSTRGPRLKQTFPTISNK